MAEVSNQVFHVNTEIKATDTLLYRHYPEIVTTMFIPCLIILLHFLLVLSFLTSLRHFYLTNLHTTFTLLELLLFSAFYRLTDSNAILFPSYSTGLILVLIYFLPSFSLSLASTLFLPFLSFLLPSFLSAFLLILRFYLVSSFLLCSFLSLFLLITTFYLLSSFPFFPPPFFPVYVSPYP